MAAQMEALERAEAAVVAMRAEEATRTQVRAAAPAAASAQGIVHDIVGV